MILFLLLYQATTNSCFSSQLLLTQNVQYNRLPASIYTSIVEVEKIHIEHQITPSNFNDEGDGPLADDLEILANDVLIPSVQKVIQSSRFTPTVQKIISDSDVTVRIRKTLPGNAYGVFLPDENLGVFQDKPAGKSSLLIYVSEQTPQELLERTVVHELFHAIQNRITKQPNWINEGLALLFEYKILGTFNLDYYLAAFQKVSTPLTATISLTEQSSTSNTSPETYGHLLLYFYYLDRECAADSNKFFWSIAEKGVTRTLQEMRSLLPSCVSFESSVENFELARVLNKSTNHGSSVHLIQAKTLDTAQPQTTQDAQANLDRIEKTQPVFVTAFSAKQLNVPNDVRIYCIKRSQVPEFRPLQNLLSIPAYCEFILFLK